MADRPGGFTVAVLEDDESILHSLGGLLESAGYGVRLFNSATRLLESSRLSEIDCLISDIDMPAMSSIELLARLHVLCPGCRTILVTAYPDRLKGLSPLDEVYPGLFTKPVKLPELLEAVRDVLRNAKN